MTKSNSKYEKGKLIRGTVTAIESYGAFVACDEYYTGLIHISEITDSYVKDVNNYLKKGEVIYCKILDVDEDNGHLKLSIKNLNNRKKCNPRRTKIIETPQGFKSLAYHLPYWIEESLKKIKNK